MTQLSPMLVQYLVALCCLKWDREAVDVTIGDMVYDPAAEKERDVDVTVTIKESPTVTRAFKAYEVKRESAPLDVATVEQLCIKLLDMPSVTHRAIVSASGFTSGAQTKAQRHNVELYEFRAWTRPLQEQFPAFAMNGTIEECFPGSKVLLYWMQPKYALIAPDAKATFSVEPEQKLFGEDGKFHDKYKTFAEYQNELLLRSTEILIHVDPVTSVFRTFPIPFCSADGLPPSGPAWPHTHTLDVVSDAIHVETGSGLCQLAHITITGHLQWQRSSESPQPYVIEHIPSGEAFAGALISAGERDGNMIAIVFSPKTREIGFQFVQLAKKHHNCIRRLKLELPDCPSDA